MGQLIEAIFTLLKWFFMDILPMILKAIWNFIISFF